MEKNIFSSADPEVLKQLITWKMPYGRYQGLAICDIPEHYLVWYRENGFPEGRLGMLLSTMYEIKLNGLEYLLRPLKKNL